MSTDECRFVVLVTNVIALIATCAGIRQGNYHPRISALRPLTQLSVCMVELMQTQVVAFYAKLLLPEMVCRQLSQLLL